MNIAVLTPDREIFHGPIKSVKVPGTKGEFQVLENHAPIVSSLDPGRVEIVTGDGEYSYFNEESGQIETAREAGRKLIYLIEGG
ncbi:MAG: F0F1 ATP synthase subunit epsilon, partial [Lewinella sp.]|nr:F0F1 ATP synthase subunit epsilon [Lewinella sp.]